MLGVILVMALAFFSCEEENILGSNINPAEDRLEVQFKEFVLPATNLFSDSVRTDRDSYILTGTFTDEIYGKMEAEGYQTLDILNTIIPADSARLDSVVLSLRFLTYHTDPSAKMHELVVHQAADTIHSAGIYLSNRKATLNRNLDGTLQELGRVRFETDPSRDSVITVKLTNAFGESLLRLLDERRDDFRTILPGELGPIALSTADGNDALIGFNPNNAASNITLHYHTYDEENMEIVEDSLFYRFEFNGGANFDFSNYNYVNVDRSASLFSGITGDESQVIDPDPDHVFLNPVTGIYPMVDLREIYEFFEDKVGDDSNLNIISSQLAMPMDGSDTTAFQQINDNLRYLFADENGNFDGGQVLLNPGRNIILTDDSYLGLTNGNVITVGLVNNETFSITSDITLFTQLMIENRLNSDVEEGAFPTHLVMVPIRASSFDQSTFFKEGIKVRVYYSVLNQ